MRTLTPPPVPQSPTHSLPPVPPTPPNSPVLGPAATVSQNNNSPAAEAPKTAEANNTYNRQQAQKARNSFYRTLDRHSVDGYALPEGLARDNDAHSIKSSATFETARTHLEDGDDSHSVAESQASELVSLGPIPTRQQTGTSDASNSVTSPSSSQAGNRWSADVDSNGNESSGSPNSELTPQQPQPSKSKGLQSFIKKFNIPFSTTKQPAVPKQPEGTFADIPVSKGLQQCCASLAHYHIGANALQNLKDALDGKTAFATAPILAQSLGTTTASGSAIAEDVKGIRIVAKALMSALKQNLVEGSDEQLRERAGTMVHRLIDLCCDKSSYKTYEAINPELQFWGIAERRLLDAGMPKNKIVESREKFLAALKQCGAKEQHIKQLLERIIAPNEFSQLLGTEASIKKLIENYIEEVKGKADAAQDLPSKKQINSIVNSIVKLVKKYQFADVDIFSQKSEFHKLNKDVPEEQARRVYLDKDYQERKAAIKNAFKEEWLNSWRKATVAPAYKMLKEWPKDIRKALKEREKDLNTLTPPEQKTRLINAAHEEGGNSFRSWILDAALSQANMFIPGITTEATEMKAKLISQDAVKLREWTSLYLGNVIDFMKEQDTNRAAP